MFRYTVCLAAVFVVFERPASVDAGDKARPRVDLWGDPLPAEALLRLGSVRFRHQNAVTAIAFSPDGKTLASADSDGRGYLWRVSDGKEIRRFIGHEFFVTALAFSPDGKLLATASVDESVRLWVVATGAEVRQLTAGNTVAAVVFSPDGKRLAFAGEDRTVRIRDTETGTEALVFRGHAKGIRALAYSPDGQILASAGKDQGIRLWQTSSGSMLRVLSGHTSSVQSLAFAPDGKTLASADSDVLRLWDVASGREVRKRKGYTPWLAFSPRGSMLASAANTRAVRLWDYRGNDDASPRYLPAPAENFAAIAISPDGKLLARASASHVVRLWDLAGGNEITPLPGHREGIDTITFAPDGKLLATASRDGTARLWDAATGKEIHKLAAHDIRALAFSTDGKHLATAASTRRSLQLWDTASGRKLHSYADPDARIIAPVLAPDAGLLAYAAQGDGSIGLWDVRAGKEIRRLQGIRKAPTCLEFSDDGRVLVAAAADTARLWDMATHKELLPLNGLAGEDNPIKAIALSADGRILATGGEDTEIRLWETASGKRVRNLKGSPAPSLALAFSPNLRLLAAAGKDHIVRIWDTVTGQAVHQFAGHRHAVTSLSFTPDGRRLASAGADAGALVWDVSALAKLPPPFPIRTANLPRLWQELAGFNATQAEDVIWSLAAVPEQAIPFLATRFRPVPPVDPDRLKELIADLDHGSFTRRQQAFAALETLEEAAAGALRERLTRPSSLEHRLRMRRLVDRIEKKSLAEEMRRVPRVIRILERCGTPEARTALAELARGAPGAGRTEQARAALARLEKRRPR
jgi:WD40 repeat protein